MAGTVEDNEHQTAQKREAITHTIHLALDRVGLTLKEYDGTLTPGAELIDTGSTGRGTNAYESGDFDFMMRLDKSDFISPAKMQQIRQSLGEVLGGEPIGSGDFRLKEVSIEGLAQPVSVDITFVEKTNKLNYSTDQALKDRLSTIRELSPEKYPQVIANILLAKQTLKSAGAYSPNRGATPQGGLGGAGIENWILQNGGSFESAAQSFVSMAEGKTYNEFCQAYAIWDFGENHLANQRGFYPHDNFVTNNMSEAGYEAMKVALQDFLAPTNPVLTISPESH